VWSSSWGSDAPSTNGSAGLAMQDQTLPAIAHVFADIVRHDAKLGV
jgi:hypothetical protein